MLKEGEKLMCIVSDRSAYLSLLFGTNRKLQKDSKKMAQHSFTVSEINSLDSKSAEIAQLFSIKGKVAVVTGGSRGIGLMIAHTLVANGAKVFIVARDGKVSDAAAEALTKKGPGSCISVSSSLASEADCLKVAQTIRTLNEGKAIHLLVNNAGTNWGAPFESYPDSAWDKVLALNVKTVFLFTRALLPELLLGASAQSPARVVNIGSIDGIRVPTLETYAYSASKAAVHQLTRVLAGQLASKHITVNAIAAGPFPSKMMRETLDKFHEEIVGNVPLGRIGGPNDIGGVILWLASNAGAWITGAIIPVEGGILCSASL